MKKKKNGFTLVELLAVIVVLALILVITIPTIVTILRRSQKESFFMYAQNLQSKAITQYNQDIEDDDRKLNCVVYDIGSDLGISNTGSYEGWVKVTRTPVESGKHTAEINVSNNNGIKYLKYCVADGDSCTPTKSQTVEENAKEATVKKSLFEGQVLCVNYQYPDGTNLKNGPTTCKKYTDGTSEVDTYEYKITITLKDDNYAVEDVVFNEKMSESIFYAKIDDFNAAHKSDAQKLAIKAPTCSAEESSIKGTTTRNTSLVSSSTTSSTRTTRVTNPGNTKEKTSQVTTNNDDDPTNVPTSQVTDPTERPTESSQVTTEPTSERPTSNVTDNSTEATTNVNETVFLQSLNVAGYDQYLNFNKLKFRYELNVPYDVTSLNVSATPEHPETVEVIISGQDNFNVGNNPIVIAVVNTERPEERNIYRVVVRRFDIGETPLPNTDVNQPTPPNGVEDGKPDPTLKESDASLSYLAISGYNLDFNPEVYEYTLTTNGESKLYVNYRPSSSSAAVAVSGNEDLSDGDSILVFVQSENGYYHNTYTIKIAFDEPTSITTKVLRGVAVGLGVLLLIILIIIAIRRNRKVIIDDTENVAPEDIV